MATPVNATEERNLVFAIAAALARMRAAALEGGGPVAGADAVEEQLH